MSKLLRFSLFAFGCIVTVLLIAMIVLVALIDPNDFKEEIAKSIHQHTGRSFTIEGDIQWRFFPSFGIQAKKIVIGNSPGFDETPFAKLESAALELRLSRLLFGQVAVGAVNLTEGHVFLKRLSNGRVNWETPSKPIPTQSSLASPYIMVISAAKPAKKSPIALSISSLDLHNFTVEYRDQLSNNNVDIDNFHFSGRDIQFDAPFTIKGSGNIKTESLAGPAEFKGNVTLYTSRQEYILSNFSLEAKTHFSQTPDVQQSTALSIDAEADLELGQIELKSLSGLLFDNPIDAQFVMHQAKGRPVVNGYIKSPRLKWQRLEAQAFDAKIYTESNAIYLKPIQATLYEGALNAHVKITAENDAPLEWESTATITSLNGEKLSAALLPAPILSGSASIELQAHGTHQNAPQDTLNSTTATMQLTAENGSLIGFDLQKLFLALARKKEPTQTGYETLFDQLSGTFILKNGLITNENLRLTAKDYTAKGAGQLQLSIDDIPSSSLDYVIQANAPKISKELPLAIRIYGTLHEVKVEPDLNSYLRTLLKKQFKKGLFEQLNKGGTLPADSPSEAQPDRDQEEAPIQKLEDFLENAGSIFRR